MYKSSTIKTFTCKYFLAECKSLPKAWAFQKAFRKFKILKALQLCQKIDLAY